jgi:DNA-nicking Smr family endonuclease
MGRSKPKLRSRSGLSAEEGRRFTEMYRPGDGIPEDWEEQLRRSLELDPAPADPERDAEAADGSPRRRRRGARRSGDKSRPDRTLDLHHRTREQARELLRAALAELRARGGGTLLVITGRGLHSEGGPVLKEWLVTWARQEAPGAPLDLRPARIKHGGAGAFYIRV